MKNIIIRKEWIEILERQSTQFRDTVMGAVYSFAIRGTDPTDLDPTAMLAYEFIKTEMLRLDESLDFDAATEAAIKKKRAAERRAERAAQKAAEREAQQQQNSESDSPVRDGQQTSNKSNKKRFSAPLTVAHSKKILLTSPVQTVLHKRR